MNIRVWILLALCLTVSAAGAAQLPDSQREAFDEVKRQASKGDAQAQLTLGTMYENGVGVSRDVRQAAKWHRRAAEQGLARAQYELGMEYATGAGVKQDKEEAAAWFERAANQGLPEAQFSLGLWYLNGRGVAPNTAVAIKWFKKAADQGYADAESELGNCYLEGTGVVKDPAEGVKSLRHSAEKGSASGQRRLGRCLEQGTGTKKDLVEAYQWYALAAAQDQDQAADLRLSLAKLETVLSPAEVSEAQRRAREFKPGSSAETSAESNARSSADAAKRGAVLVTSDTEDCELFVDGAFVGNPPARLHLSEGSHTLEVKKGGFEDYRRELNVSPGSELTLRVKLIKR